MSTTRSRLSRYQSLHPEPLTQAVYHGSRVSNECYAKSPICYRIFGFFCCLAYIAFAVFDVLRVVRDLI